MSVLLGTSLVATFSTVFGAHLPRVADALAGTLLSAVWEGGLLVLAMSLALRLTPGLSAAMRTRLWLGMMVVLLVLPAVLLALGQELPAGLLHTAHFAAVRPVQASSVWSVFLLLAWAVLSSARAVQLLASAVRLRRVARAAVPVEPGAELAGLLAHGGRTVELCVSAEAGRPSVVGFLRPRILLPPALFTALTTAELRQVLLHEMEHLLRHDDWTNLLQKLALVALPLHPALFWAERRLGVERELACDDAVLRATAGGAVWPATARKAYAACLVALAEHSMLRRGAALALGALGRQSELARRVHRLLARPEPTLQPAAARRTMGGLLGGVLAAAAVLAVTPQMVRFAPDGAGLTMAAAAPMPVMDGGPGDRVLGISTLAGGRIRVQQAIAHMDGSRAHVTLASAVLPAASAAQKHHDARRTAVSARTRGVSAEAVRSARALDRTRQVARVPEAGRLRQIRFADDGAAPVSGLVFLTDATEIRPVLTLAVSASDDEFSPSYAAVPVRGGWLLVQL